MDQSETSLQTLRQTRLSLLRLALRSALIGGLVVWAFIGPMPLITIQPGPTFDTAKLVKVEANTYPPEGSYHMATVTLYEATFAQAVWGWIQSDVGVIPREAIYPPDVPTEQVDREIAAQMDESEYAAGVAALQELGYGLERDGALVRATRTETPAAAKLKPGDVIVSVNGQPVSSPDDVGKILSTTTAGGDVILGYRREQRLQEIEIATVRRSKTDPAADLGVDLLQDYRYPFAITIDAGDVGGPSAGLAFALTLVDLLGPGDMSRGRVVAGTGEIKPDGSIGKIGGMAQKVAAVERLNADVFFVPEPDYEDAVRAARASRLKVIGVKNLHQAVLALEGD